jgi:predicted metalloprotease
MRINRGYRSNDVEDRRAQGATGGGGFGGGGGVNILFMLFQRFGLPGVLVGAAFLYFSGGFGGGGESRGITASGEQSPESLAAEQPLVELVSFVFDDAQATWSEQFAKSGKPYQPAKLVLFRGSTSSGCGVGQAAMGPFYCPADGKAYIDLSFYQEMKQRLGAPGDFAQAYVIAHELGHHVQSLLGESERVHRAPKSQQTGDGGLLVRLELQADCYAGIWGHGTQRREILETGDLDEALKAATAIGDDALQRQSTGVVRPESFTHGSSAQRKRWFQRGFESGDPKACDTFATEQL